MSIRHQHINARPKAESDICDLFNLFEKRKVRKLNNFIFFLTFSSHGVFHFRLVPLDFCSEHAIKLPRIWRSTLSQRIDRRLPAILVYDLCPSQCFKYCFFTLLLNRDWREMKQNFEWCIANCNELLTHEKLIYTNQRNAYSKCQVYMLEFNVR